MQLTCKVNQAEAIRRGFNTSSTIKLDIDPATLTPEERATLADNFSSGEFKQGYSDGQIPEPTVDGFLETLRQLVAKSNEDKEKEKERYTKSVAIASDSFAKRQTTSRSPQIFANLIDGEVKICGQYEGEANTRGRSSYQCLEPYNCYGGSATTWADLMQSPEGVAWQAELDQANAAAKAQAEAQAIAHHHKRVAAAEAEAEKLAAFHQWALTHGSETLRLRAEEGFEWQSLAEWEWADSLLTKAGITDTPLPEMPGYDQDSSESEQPTAAQIKNLRRFREALAKLTDAPTEVTLRDFTYTENIPDEDNMGQDPEVIKRTEVCVDITTPTGKDVTRYFEA